MWRRSLTAENGKSVLALPERLRRTRLRSVPTAHRRYAWPEPMKHLDNRELDPPEPMVRILAATETMQPGEVLAALLLPRAAVPIPRIGKART